MRKLMCDSAQIGPRGKKTGVKKKGNSAVETNCCPISVKGIFAIVAAGFSPVVYNVSGCVFR